MTSGEPRERPTIENFHICTADSKSLACSRTAQAATDLPGPETRQRIVSSRNSEKNTKYVRGDRFSAQLGRIE